MGGGRIPQTPTPINEPGEVLGPLGKGTPALRLWEGWGWTIMEAPTPPLDEPGEVLPPIGKGHKFEAWEMAT